ncbi:MAG: homoserine kinase [Coriobacteriia bacterium]|nr:homoserine kinase [Coriobacteriia bacterium]
MLPLTVRVPASSANLGPGYDAFGVALGLHARFSAEVADEWSVRVVGEGAAELPAGLDNPVVLAMRRVFGECGDDRLRARVFCHSRIPVGRGFGSSAAAIVAGCVLADALCSVPLGRDTLFGIAVGIEGHADNVAAALYGGFTVAWRDEAGARCTRIDPPGLAAVLLPAGGTRSTPEARAALPPTVSHGDAAFTAGRAGLMAAGLALGRPDLVRYGAEDRLHEPYRSGGPRTAPDARRALLEAGADAAVLSGSGPSLVALVVDASDGIAMHRAERVAKRVRRALRSIPDWEEPLAVAVDREGAVLEDR